jgi:hypothetical protein
VSQHDREARLHVDGDAPLMVRAGLCSRGHSIQNARDVRLIGSGWQCAACADDAHDEAVSYRLALLDRDLAERASPGVFGR